MHEGLQRCVHAELTFMALILITIFSRTIVSSLRIRWQPSLYFMITASFLRTDKSMQPKAYLIAHMRDTLTSTVYRGLKGISKHNMIVKLYLSDSV